MPHAIRRRMLAALLSATLCTSAFAIQQTQPSVPAVPTTNGAAQPLKITVTGIEGIVQVRTAEDQPWKRAEVGMELDENAEFRTAPRSAVRFTIPPDQTITLDRLGTVKVVEAINDSGKLKTKLGMKYGRTRYDIESAGQEHEASISSPSSTLAIRGTRVTLYDQRPFLTVAISLTGRAQFKDIKKSPTAIGSKGAKTPSKVDGSTANAAEYAFTQTVVDPLYARARSNAEQGLIDALVSSGATVDYDFQKGIKVVTGGDHPRTDEALAPFLAGGLDFVLRWDTPGSDINLAVISPPDGSKDNKTVYPVAGLNVLTNGGRIDFDHRGGPKGGIEIASFPKDAPKGSYNFGASYISGPVVDDATIDVYVNKNLVKSSDGPVTPQTGDVEGNLFDSFTFPPTGSDAQQSSAAKVKAHSKKKH